MTPAEMRVTHMEKGISGERLRLHIPCRIIFHLVWTAGSESLGRRLDVLRYRCQALDQTHHACCIKLDAAWTDRCTLQAHAALKCLDEYVTSQSRLLPEIPKISVRIR